MITECAALIKTHDYRPQRTLKYPATAIPSQGEALPMRFSCAHCRCSSRIADYKLSLFDIAPYLSEATSNDIFSRGIAAPTGYIKVEKMRRCIKI